MFETDMASSDALLATYGTLMRAFGRQEALGIEEELTFVSTCRVRGQLYDLGSFPGAVPRPGIVHGELFRLRTSSVWSVLDRYEGYDADDEESSLFVRRRVSLDGFTGETVWIYWYNRVTEGHSRVPSGNWAAYVE